MVSLYDWLLDENETGGTSLMMSEYLYRYTDGDGLAYAVSGDQIRMNLFDRMNDPRESRRWAAPKAIGVPPLTDDRVQQHIDERIRQSARLLSLSTDRRVLDADAAHFLLHRGWARAAMWSHYADNHHGVCMIFNTTDLMEAVSNVPVHDGQYTTWGTLKYRDQKVTIDIVGDFSDLGQLDDAIEEYLGKRDNIPTLYMTKNRDWSSEIEVRAAVIYPKMTRAELKSSLMLPLGSMLKGVIFGEAHPAPALVAAGTRGLMGRRAPDFYRVTWDGGAPALHAV